MNTPYIRPAYWSDLEQLVSLFNDYRQFYGRSSDPDAARAFLNARFTQGDSVLFIAQDDEHALGFTQLYPSYSSVSLARIYILNDLFVAPPFRRQGLARQLIHTAVEFAKAQQAVRLSLSTALDNASAQALYQSAGWTRDEQFCVYHRTL